MLTYLRTGLVGLCIVTLLGCAGPDVYGVKHQSEKGYDFSGLKTYDWLKVDVGTDIDQDAEDLLRAAVDRELTKKGYRKVTDNPDFKVILYIYTKEAVTYQTWGPALGAVRHVEEVRYEEGTVIIDMMDAKSKIIFWSGTLSAEIYKEPLPPEAEKKRINQGMARLLKRFPSRSQ